MARVRVVLSDRDAKRLRFSGQHYQFLAARDARINAVAFEQHVLLHCQRNHNHP